MTYFGSQALSCPQWTISREPGNQCWNPLRLRFASPGTKDGRQSWHVETTSGKISMLPFIAIEDQQYSTYLAGAINFSSGCPVMFLFQNQSSLSPNSSRSELLVHMDYTMKNVLQKNGALTSHARLRKRRAKATGFRNRLHIFDSCYGRIATEPEQYTRKL